MDLLLLITYKKFMNPWIPNQNYDDLSIKSITNIPQILSESSFSPILTIGNNGNNTYPSFKISYFNEGLLAIFFGDEIINLKSRS